jgi:tRNA-Thr(GGU) m(6)t(6)A37 methyltransferase TsaA
MELTPIGLVRSEVKEIGRRDWKDLESEIVVDADFEEALDGLEEFSHIHVIFGFHKSQWAKGMTLRIHPQGRSELPLVGLFATRSPVRPNRLGLTVVRLVARHGNSLIVRGLDAIDGTPVYDIKPYLPGDSQSWTIMPEWVHKLHVFGTPEQS